ncbi:MAG TPA: hypothetical protein VFT13_01080 [Candidatus Krumholzibacteria bacterium]|nr:hypothetical protein [Candidatus Krumholzibacteria bacterium]
MKTTVQSVRLLCLAALVATVAACDDDKTDDTVSTPSTPLRVQEIIVSPKAAAPEDTVALTADIRSSSANVGDIPSTKWTADGGTFVEDNKMTVRWVAPATGGFYTVSVKATNAAGSVTAQAEVFVGATALLVTSEAGAVRMKANGADFYYRRSPDADLGVEVFSYAGGVASDAVAPVRPTGFELVYSPDASFEVHATSVNAPESLGVATANPRPRQIYVGDLTLGTMQRISQDLAAFDSTRRNQFAYPSVSPDGQLVAYQGTVTNPGTSSLDSVDVFVYRFAGPTRIRATFTHSNHKNFFPAFSTDQNWLTFISDRGGSTQWEIYGMPVSGTTVDTAPGSVVRLTDTGGTITATRPGAVPAFPLSSWNPVASTLAIVSGDNTLYLMSTNAGGASLDEVMGIPISIQELVWAPSGNQLAVVATGKDSEEQSVMQIYSVTGGAVALEYQAIPGDLVRDVAFSPNEEWMVFRVTRSGSAWLEMMDTAGGALASSVPVTASSPAGDASSYRPLMSLSPAWGVGNILYFPDFTGGPTPGIRSVDVSGAVQ